ncbi:MAG: response regulator, partial [Lachnospiraceae bacterium]|nr:response regulator [Lachnospiraceae bacterium]
TYLPAMGQHAVSTSGIGGALCAIVMWYGAIRLNAFDIRMGYVKDRLFDFVEAGIIVFDVDRRIAMLNRFSKKLADEMSEAPRGLNDFFLISRAVAQEMFLRAENGLYATRLTDRAGVKSYSVRITAMRDNFGEIFCYMCVFSDVTEEVEFAAKFSVASRAKSRFLAQMSHEIRTPINAVLGMNEMILREAADPDILEYASNIDAAGNTLLSLINSILDFSKIEDGKMEIIPVQYDTASFIYDLVNSIIQRADAKGLALDVKVDENLPRAMIGDDVRFSQIIMNLLTNAVKYTPKGTVTFTIRMEEKKADTVRLFVSVKDTGMGIKKEDLGKLYESFERLDEIKNHNIEGTGLGISIVTSLLELMGSRLEVESTYGEGSRFWFTVEQQIADDTPIGDYEKRLKESRRGREEDQLICAPGARVLLVDDNEMNLKVAKNLLKLCGIEPDMVLSGQQTIEAMQKKTYDIVFLDHMMPGMDGVETLAGLLKEDLVPKETTMIALTANAVVGARERYLAAGFADYLSNPIEVKELEEKLKEYLPGEAYRTEALPAAADQAPDVPGEAIARQGGVYAQSVDAGGAEVFEFAPADAAGGADGVIEFAAADTASRTGTVTETGPADEGVRYDIDRLAQLGIDTDTGMNYCASDESIYFETLGDYTVACEEKAAMMGALFDAKNWKEYGVMVHAAKSNSKMIGATELSKQALALEKAATRGDVSYIKEHHEDFLEADRRLGEGIRGAAAG